MRRVALGSLLALIILQPVAAQFRQPAVTTSFADADHAVYLSDDFSPGDLRPLVAQPAGPTGGYLLAPGAYRTTVMTFCLHAGTYGPSKGDGYLYAPLKGSQAGIIRAVLRNAPGHPDVAQTDVQSLLWAIEAGMRVGDLAPGARRAAMELLGPDDIASLELNQVQDLLERRVLAGLPPRAAVWLDVHARLRTLLSDPNAGFAQIERLAVRRGVPPSNGTDIPRGRWSSHPSGAFVRYLPDGYSQTDLEVYVPDEAADLRHRIAFDPRGDVAIPANTSSQRLGVSGPVGRVTNSARH